MTILRKTLLAMACIAAFPVAAQTVTTPPRSITSQQETQGNDSTFQGNIQPNNSQVSTLQLPISNGGGNGGGNPPPPSPPPPSVTCLSGQQSTSTVTQTASCPAGYETYSGALSFVQSATRTTTTSCPSGPYGAPSYTTSDSAWSPSQTAACPVPVVQHLANDGNGYAMNVTIPYTYMGRFASGNAALEFQAMSTGWRIVKAGWGQAATTVDSGSLPTGAVSVAYVIGTVVQNGDGVPAHNATVTNGAPSAVPVASAPFAQLSTATIRGNTAGDSNGTVKVTANFFNAAGQLVGTATITFQVSAAGSA